MDPKHVRRIMDRYFLLGFVIVDESQEMCQFIFDGEIILLHYHLVV